jgi:hypothetical protein
LPHEAGVVAVLEVNREHFVTKVSNVLDKEDSACVVPANDRIQLCIFENFVGLLKERSRNLRGVSMVPHFYYKDGNAAFMALESLYLELQGSRKGRVGIRFAPYSTELTVMLSISRASFCWK